MPLAARLFPSSFKACAFDDRPGAWLVRSRTPISLSNSMSVPVLAALHCARRM